MRQLVKGNEVIRLPLILDLVLAVLHRAENDLRAARERPCVVAPVVAGAREQPRVVAQRLVDQLRELGKGLSQDQALIVRDIDLPQGLDHKRVAFAAALTGSTAV